MKLHRNAALGIAGRRRLVMLIEAGLSQRQAAAEVGRVAGDGPSLGQALEGGLGQRARFGQGPVGPLEPPSPLAASAERRPGGADPGRPRGHQSGPGAPGPHLSPGPLDDLEGPLAPRPVASESGAAPAGAPLRVGPPGGAAPRRYGPPGALSLSGPPHPRAQGRRHPRQRGYGPCLPPRRRR